VGGTRRIARVVVICTLTCAASATPAYAQDAGGLGNLVGQAVQQVAGALPQVPLPQPARPAPAPAVPAEPAPRPPAPAAPGPAAPQAPAPAAPKPADPVAPAEPAAGGPVGPSQDKARAAPSSPQTSPSAPARRANPEMGGRTPTRTGLTTVRGDARIRAGRGGEDRAARRAGALFGRGSDARGRRSGAGRKASASRASARDAGDGAEAPGTQSGDSGAGAAQTGGSGAAAAQAGDPGAVATADPVATGAQATEDSSGALPFTGSGVPLLAAIGLLGIAAGLLLRRMNRRVTRAGA
jgi:translation initiation factor IF-2